MNMNSIIEMPVTYISPSVIVVPFESEGILCQSTEMDNGGDHGNPEHGGSWDEDAWD